MSQQIIYRAYKYALDPTPTQEEALRQHGGAARAGYNWALSLINEINPYSRYREEYFETKLRETYGDKPTRAQKRKNYADNAAAAKAYAEEQKRLHQERLTEELKAEGWSEQRIKRHLRCTAEGLADYWTKNRDEIWDWYGDSGINVYAPKEAMRHAATAYQDSLSGKKKPPRYKRKSARNDSFILYGNIRLSPTHARRLLIPSIAVKVSKVEKAAGHVAGIRVHGNLRNLRRALKRHEDNKICSVTFSQSGKRWYISVLVSETITVPDKLTPTQRTGGVIGGDLGVKSLITLSDGTAVENKRRGKKMSRKVTKAQKTFSRRVGARKGEPKSNRYKRAAERVAALQHKAALQRKGDLHQLTKRLTTQYGVVVIEDLNVAGMVSTPEPKPDPSNPQVFLPNGRAAKTGLNRSILDVGFYEFKRQLSYKAGWYGTTVVIVPRWEPTSKRCSDCGVVRTKLSLSERTFECSGCGSVYDRDHNAARNIKQLAKNALLSPTTSGRDKTDVDVLNQAAARLRVLKRQDSGGLSSGATTQ